MKSVYIFLAVEKGVDNFLLKISIQKTIPRL